VRESAFEGPRGRFDHAIATPSSFASTRAPGATRTAPLPTLPGYLGDVALDEIWVPPPLLPFNHRKLPGRVGGVSKASPGNWSQLRVPRPIKTIYRIEKGGWKLFIEITKLCRGGGRQKNLLLRRQGPYLGGHVLACAGLAAAGVPSLKHLLPVGEGCGLIWWGVSRHPVRGHPTLVVFLRSFISCSLNGPVKPPRRCVVSSVSQPNQRDDEGQASRPDPTHSRTVPPFSQSFVSGGPVRARFRRLGRLQKVGGGRLVKGSIPMGR